MKIRDFLNKLFWALGGIALLFSTGLILLCLFLVLTVTNTASLGNYFALLLLLPFLPLFLGISAMVFALGTWLDSQKGGIKIVSNIILSIGSLISSLYGLGLVLDIDSIQVNPVPIISAMNENTMIVAGIVLGSVIYACLITQGTVFIKNHFSRKTREQYISV